VWPDQVQKVKPNYFLFLLFLSPPPLHSFPHGSILVRLLFQTLPPF
jgi:hypothetical protein